MYDLLQLHNFTTEGLDILTNRVWSNYVAISNMFLTPKQNVLHRSRGVRHTFLSNLSHSSCF